MACGPEYIDKLQVMFADMDRSNDLTEKFSANLRVDGSFVTRMWVVFSSSSLVDYITFVISVNPSA